MSTMIGLISDVHATPIPLQEALGVLAAHGAETILCAGDIAGYGPDLDETVRLLADARVRAIAGNHDLWRLADSVDEEIGPVEIFLRRLPLVDELEIDGCRIAMVHGSPPASVMEGVRLLDEEGILVEEACEFWSEALRNVPTDVLVVGHTHQVFAERLGGTLVINPGSTRFNHSCAILHLPECAVEFLPLGGQAIAPVWNWGMQYRR